MLINSPDCSTCLFSWYGLLITVGGVGGVGGDFSQTQIRRCAFVSNCPFRHLHYFTCLVCIRYMNYLGLFQVLFRPTVLQAPSLISGKSFMPSHPSSLVFAVRTADHKMCCNFFGIIYYIVYPFCELDSVIMWRSNNDTLYLMVALTFYFSHP